MKFNNHSVTRNFHAMKERKDFFRCYSYSLMTHFISDKMQTLLWKNLFLCAVWSRQCWESRDVSEDNWEHLLPDSWFCVGCTWAGGCGSQVWSLWGSQLSAGDRLASASTEAGQSPSVSEVSEIGVFFSLWLDQRLAVWCQKLPCFWKMGVK